MQICRKIKFHPLAARACGAQCDSWKGSEHVWRNLALWTAKGLGFATLSVGPGISRNASTRIATAASCARSARLYVHDRSPAAFNEADKRALQNPMWKTFYRDHVRWSDKRNQNRNPCLPDFRYKEAGASQWLASCYKSAWVDVQLDKLDVRMDHSDSAASPWSLSSDHSDQPIGFWFDKWSESVTELCQLGDIKEAVKVLGALVGMNFDIDKHLLYTVLKKCVEKEDFMLGGQVHALAVEMGFGSDTFLCNHFIRMYARQGKLKEAMHVFRGVALPDAFMWSSIISAHVKLGQAERAIQLYQHRRVLTAKANGYVLVAALHACAVAGDLESGKRIHDDVLANEMEHDIFVCNSLVDMYAKCGSLKDARRVFDRLGKKDLVTWNAMIAGYARVEGMGGESLSLLSAMRREGMVAPDAVTFVSLLQACANMGVSALEKGKQFHLQLRIQGLESHAVLGGSLVNMYKKCGSLEDARIVFDGLSEKSVVTWNAMIAGYAQQQGMSQNAFSLFGAMHTEGRAAPDAVTFVGILQACANVGASALEKGKQLHFLLKDRRLESDVVVGGSLVNMYVKCGSLEDARIVFDGFIEKNLVMWNAMIAGYAQQEGMGQEAFSLFNAMLKEGMPAPDAVTFVGLLQACANVGVSALEKGKELHSLLEDQKLESDVVVGGSLVNMYAKCGSLKDARRVFDGLREKDVVTWTAMIAGYAQHEGMGQEALRLFSAMHNEGIATPDALIYVSLLEACTSIGALQQGKQLHSEICKGGFDSNALVGGCLVRMYAKCGSLEVSREVFDRLPMKDLVTWNALLKEYAEHGEGHTAMQCFDELLEQGMQPDEVTYTCLFTACSHAGLVDQGQQYFETMVQRHGVEPNEWHYNCMVDLLGRSGHLHKAEQMLRASGLAGDVVSWTALLSACKSYGDAETGRRSFDHLVKLQPTLATAYVLLGSIYASAGRWDEVHSVECLRKAAGARKLPAKACIEVKKKVHEFTVGEERSDVATALKMMNTKVRENGHVPQTQVVLRAVSEQEKEDALCGHAEKLALAYGLLNTPAGSTLVVTKNLRMCDDCHISTKIMSHLEKRDIVVRDGHKVHRFQNGVCSCLDRP